MPFDTIEKTVANAGPTPNLGDYETARRDFTWDAVRAELAGLPGGGVNIAHEALDRHLAAGRGDRRALRWIGKDEIDPEVDLREEMDIDSMDFLNFVIALHKRLGVDIPETDYPKLFTVNGAVDYLAAKSAA